MAITNIKTPATHTPAFNDQWFTSTSTQTAQPNFQFYVVITVHYYNGSSYTSTSYNVPINNPPDSVMRFNAMSYVRNRIKPYTPFNVTGWQKVVNGIVKVVVNVGERYGTTPAVYSGSNYTYYAWNASLSFKEQGDFLTSGSYLASTYVANNGATFPILNDQPDIRVSQYSQNFIYILCDSDNVISKARVHSNDGATIPTTSFFDITNTMLASGNWYDRYLCLNVAPYVMASLGGGNWLAVAGTTYTVDLYDNAGVVRKTVSFNYDDVCSKSDKYQLMYLNKKGATDTMFFELVSEIDWTNEKTEVSHTPYYDLTASGAMEYTIRQATKFVTSVKEQKGMKVRTNWITDAQCTTLIDNASSPITYIQDVNTSPTIIYPCIIKDGKYRENKKFNSKLHNLETTIEIANTNYRQSGV